MLEWLAANWLPLLVVILAIAGITAYLIKKKGLRQIAIDAIVWAEKEFKSEQGAIKMQNAIDYCQQILPVLNLIPDNLIKAFLQTVFDQIREALKVNQNVEQDSKENCEENKG